MAQSKAVKNLYLFFSGVKKCKLAETSAVSPHLLCRNLVEGNCKLVMCQQTAQSVVC